MLQETLFTIRTRWFVLQQRTHRQMEVLRLLLIPHVPQV